MICSEKAIFIDSFVYFKYNDIAKSLFFSRRTMLYTQIDLRTYHLYRENYEADLKAMGNDVVLLSLCEFFEQGEERAEVLKHLSEALVRLKSLGYTVAEDTDKFPGLGISALRAVPRAVRRLCQADSL